MNAREQRRGIVFDIKRYAIHDGPGIRVVVHLKGCPMACLWCHNPESQAYRPQLLFRDSLCIGCALCVGTCPSGAIMPGSFGTEEESLRCSGCGACVDICPSGARALCGRTMNEDEVMKEILKERLFIEQSGGGVTFSGGEPLGQPEFVMALLKECKKNEIHTAIDTCGFVSLKTLLDSIPYTDLYLYDVKHMDPQKHKEYTGVDNEIILTNLVKLGEAGAAINARMPFIPGINTDEENIRATAAFLAEVKGITRLNLLPYHSAAEDKHNRWGMKYKLKGSVFTPAENSLRKAVRIIEGYGIQAKIGG